MTPLTNIGNGRRYRYALLILGITFVYFSISTNRLLTADPRKYLTPAQNNIEDYTESNVDITNSILIEFKDLKEENAKVNNELSNLKDEMVKSDTGLRNEVSSLRHRLDDLSFTRLQSSSNISPTLSALTSSSTINTSIAEQQNLQSSQKSYPASFVDSREVLEDPDWLDIKIVQFNQTQKELEILEELKRLEVDNKDNVTLPFQRHEGVVIVSKVLWPNDIDELKRMLCLQKAAYNRFVNYDIVIFTTEPWTMEQVEDLGRVVAPARLTVTNEGPTLEGHLAGMTHDEIVFLEERCGMNRTTSLTRNLTWFHHCHDGHLLFNNLGYSWQSEFRAYHIWTHPALRDYKYMIWLDSDAYCSKTWDKDPIEAMVQQNLILLWTLFYGATRNEKLKTKMLRTYGEVLCSNTLLDGHLEPSKDCAGTQIEFRQVGGFFHITDLDVYRKDRHQTFLKELVGDYKFSRQWDDQLAVTVIPAMEDPTRAWRLRSHNFTFNIFHHKKYDGEVFSGYRNKFKWWLEAIRDNWHAGRMLCDHCFERP